MKLIKYTLYTIILFLLCITNTYASCTEEAIQEFKKIEDGYTVKYEFDKDTKIYDVIFYFPEVGRYSYSFDETLKNIKIEEYTKNSIVGKTTEAGEYKINIVGVTAECDSILKTISFKLSKYNQYANDPLCKGIEEFVLCQPTYGKEIDYETFVSRVNTYKKNQQNKVTQTKPEQEENKFIQYIKDNLIQIIIIITFIILLTITALITAKSIRKSRRLE